MNQIETNIKAVENANSQGFEVLIHLSDIEPSAPAAIHERKLRVPYWWWITDTEVSVAVRKDDIIGTALAHTAPHGKLGKFLDSGWENSDTRYPSLVESAIADWHVQSQLPQRKPSEIYW
jgi:hypothetical protein